MEEHALNEMLTEAYYKGFREGFAKGFENGYKSNCQISEMSLFIQNSMEPVETAKTPSEENEMVSKKRTKATK